MKRCFALLMACIFCLNGCVMDQLLADLDDIFQDGNTKQEQSRAKGKRGSSEKQRGQKTSGSESAQTSASTMQQEVLRMVNKERRNNGLGALSWDSGLAKVAQQRAREINRNFSHTRPNGSSWMTLLDEYRISWTSCGENIAWGQKSPAAVMNAWMNSSGHRANILKNTFTRLGVGVYQASDGTLHWVQIFAR